MHIIRPPIKSQNSHLLHWELLRDDQDEIQYVLKFLTGMLRLPSSVPCPAVLGYGVEDP